MLAITSGAEEALGHIRDSLEGLPDGAGVRISHETNAEEEQGFGLTVVAQPAPEDVVLDGHSMPVFLAPDAAEMLDDQALEGEVHGDHVHFEFRHQEDAAG